MLSQSTPESDISGDSRSNALKLTEELRAISDEMTEQSLGGDPAQDRRERAALTAEAYRELMEDTSEKRLLGNASEVAGSIADANRRDSVRVRLAEAYGGVGEIYLGREEAARVGYHPLRVEALARLAQSSGFETLESDINQLIGGIIDGDERIEAQAIKGEVLGDKASRAATMESLGRYSLFRDTSMSGPSNDTKAGYAYRLANIARHGYGLALDRARQALDGIDENRAVGALYQIAKASGSEPDKAVAVRAVNVARSMGEAWIVGPGLPEYARYAPPGSENFWNSPAELDVVRGEDLYLKVKEEGLDALQAFLAEAQAEPTGSKRDGLLAVYALAASQVVKTGSTAPGSLPRGDK